jgi:hypothetical protein
MGSVIEGIANAGPISIIELPEPPEMGTANEKFGGY